MIETTEHGAVRELRLARPPANALNTTLLRELDTALAAAFAAGPRAVLISGQPGMFSAGLDVPELLGLGAEQMLDFWAAFFGVQERLASAPIPVAAALTGHSPAGGAVLALYCDYRVMAEGKYKIGLNEVQVGLFPGPIIHGVLRRQIGPRQAERMLGGGWLVDAQEALRIGFVDRLAPAADVIAVTLEWAQHMASLPPLALAATRQIARADLCALLGKPGRADYEAMNRAWFSEETQATMRELVKRLKK